MLLWLLNIQFGSGVLFMFLLVMMLLVIYCVICFQLVVCQVLNGLSDQLQFQWMVRLMLCVVLVMLVRWQVLQWNRLWKVVYRNCVCGCWFLCSLVNFLVGFLILRMLIIFGVVVWLVGWQFCFFRFSMMMFLLILWKMLVLVFWLSVFLEISVFSYFGEVKY